MNTELRTERVVAGRVSLVTSCSGLTVEGYISCAGLPGKRVSRVAGLDPAGWRREYFRIETETAVGKSELLPKPVPDPRDFSLGLHLTPTLARGFLGWSNVVLSLGA